MDNVKEITNDNFKKEVLSNGTPVLVDFWAEWCGPCKALSPVVKELSEEYAGKLKVCKAKVDDNYNSVSKYKVSALPTIAIFKNGEIVSKEIGLNAKNKIKSNIEEVLCQE